MNFYLIVILTVLGLESSVVASFHWGGGKVGKVDFFARGRSSSLFLVLVETAPAPLAMGLETDKYLSDAANLLKSSYINNVILLWHII